MEMRDPCTTESNKGHLESFSFIPEMSLFQSSGVSINSTHVKEGGNSEQDPAPSQDAPHGAQSHAALKHA